MAACPRADHRATPGVGHRGVSRPGSACRCRSRGRGAWCGLFPGTADHSCFRPPGDRRGPRKGAPSRRPVGASLWPGRGGGQESPRGSRPCRREAGRSGRSRVDREDQTWCDRVSDREGAGGRSRCDTEPWTRRMALWSPETGGAAEDGFGRDQDSVWGPVGRVELRHPVTQVNCRPGDCTENGDSGGT